MIQKYRLLTLRLCLNIWHVVSPRTLQSQGSACQQTRFWQNAVRGTGRCKFRARTVPILSFSAIYFSVPVSGKCLDMWLLPVTQFWVIWNGVLIVTAIIAIAAALVMRKEFDRKKEKVAYNNRLLELEAKALTSQMNPHFIYNSLSTVQHL